MPSDKPDLFPEPDAAEAIVMGGAETWTFRLTPDPDGGFTAECPQLPGCFSQGETRAQTLRNVADAAASVMELAEEVPGS